MIFCCILKISTATPFFKFQASSRQSRILIRSRCSQGVWRRHDFRIMFQILANCFSWSFFKEGVRRSFKAVWSPAENRWEALPAERDRIRSSSTLDTFLRPIIGKFLFQLALDINFFLKACFLSFFINE